MPLPSMLRLSAHSPTSLVRTCWLARAPFRTVMFLDINNRRQRSHFRHSTNAKQAAPATTTDAAPTNPTEGSSETATAAPVTSRLQQAAQATGGDHRFCQPTGFSFLSMKQPSLIFSCSSDQQLRSPKPKSSLTQPHCTSCHYVPVSMRGNQT